MSALRLALRLAWRDLRGGIGAFRIFVVCFLLGVAALAAVGTVRAAIQAGLARDGAVLLGGDAEIELTYRLATPAERAAMDRIAAQVSETVEFRSMVTVARDGATERALTQVKAVDDAYPLIGEVALSPPIPLDRALAGEGPAKDRGTGDGLPGGVMERTLADRLALTPGDRFRLGTQDFVLSAILDRYPDNSGSFALGPLTIVRTADLAQSGLLGPGTLYESQYRLRLAPGTDLAAAEAEARRALDGGGVRWRDARDGAPGLSGFVDRLGAFLVLIGLSGLAVAGVGMSAAVRAYLDEKVTVIATLRTLGAGRRVVVLTYLIEIAALSALGIGLGLALGAGLPLLLAPLIAAALPVPAVFGVYPLPLAEAALYGALTAVIFTLWPLARVEDTPVALLFRDAAGEGRRLPRRPYLAATGLAAVALVAAAGAFSGRWSLALWTLGGIVLALGMLALAAALAGRLARALGPWAAGWPALRLALGAIRARRAETASVVLSVGLGLSVLAAVGQIDGTLGRAIERQLPKVAPSYFFVDIQPDQIDGFLRRMRDDPAVTRVETAPMLRGVITHIRGRPAAEVAGDHWVIRGDRGVTYSADLPAGTVLTAGAWWPPDYAGPPLISFAAEEAAEIGLSLGDELTVNLLGRDITATIASFRNVDFQSAGLGFVLSLNPAALQGAPHTWIATVHADPAAEARILRGAADAYPNITAIRVGDAIARAAEILDGIAGAVRWGAATSLVTGLVVLIGTALAGARSRTYEAAILKSLGAERGFVLRSFALRAGLLGLASALVALMAGIAGGWAVARFVLDTDYAVIWDRAVWIVLAGVAVTLAADLGFSLRAVSAKPSQLLKAAG